MSEQKPDIYLMTAEVTGKLTGPAILPGERPWVSIEFHEASELLSALEENPSEVLKDVEPEDKVVTVAYNEMSTEDAISVLEEVLVSMKSAREEGR